MRRTLAILAILATATLVGCGQVRKPMVPIIPDPLAGMPAPNSAANAVRAFDWAYTNGSTTGYPLLFTSDFVFAFAATDTAGNVYRAQPWTRIDEVGSFTKMVPALDRIQLTLDTTSTVNDDPRPGIGDPTRHKNIDTAFHLTALLKDGSAYAISGRANLFLVRGDAAAIPSGLGLSADSTRWWIDRWEDETPSGTSPAFHALPSRNATWGSFKAMFR